LTASPAGGQARSEPLARWRCSQPRMGHSPSHRLNERGSRVARSGGSAACLLKAIHDDSVATEEFGSPPHTTADQGQRALAPPMRMPPAAAPAAAATPGSRLWLLPAHSRGDGAAVCGRPDAAVEEGIPGTPVPDVSSSPMSAADTSRRSYRDLTIRPWCASPRSCPRHRIQRQEPLGGVHGRRPAHPRLRRTWSDPWR
jgi:hypothetical protein